MTAKGARYDNTVEWVKVTVKRKDGSKAKIVITDPEVVDHVLDYSGGQDTSLDVATHHTSDGRWFPYVLQLAVFFRMPPSKVQAEEPS